MRKELKKSHNTVTYIIRRLGLNALKTLDASLAWADGVVKYYVVREHAHGQVTANGLKTGFTPSLRPQPKKTLRPEDIAASLNSSDPHQGAAVAIRSNNPAAASKKPQVVLVDNGYIIDTGNRMSFHYLAPEHLYYYGVGKGLLPALRPDSSARRLGDRFAQRHGYQQAHPTAQVSGKDAGLQMLVCEVLENRHFIIPGKTNSPVTAGNYVGAPSTGQPQGMVFISEKIGQQEFPKVSGENPHQHEGRMLQLKKADPTLWPEVLPFAPQVANDQERPENHNVLPMRPRPTPGNKPRRP
ncbi:MAG: hypothetical protein ACX932_02175 [Gammaproteobacteria bacterium]